MKTFLIAGAGRQATACAAFLLEQFGDTRVLLVDRDERQLERARAAQREQHRVETHVFDTAGSDPHWPALLDRTDGVVSCVPYFLNEPLTRLAIDHNAHFCDLGGNKGTVRRQLSLAAQARDAGVSVVPDCGLAPGTGNILAEYWRHDWTYRAVSIRCGGLPKHPSNMLNYALTFSPWGLFNEYFDDCEVSRGGELVTLPGLSELESIDDLPLDGTFEAFATSGGTSVAPSLYAPLGVDYDYKTIRYPGHRDMIACMHELGFFDEKTKAARSDGTPLDATMRDIAVAAFERAMPGDRNDLVILRVDVRGEHDGQPAHGRIDLIDYADHRFTAMERTTGFSIAIVAALQVGLYRDAPAACTPPRLPDATGDRTVTAIEPGAYCPFQVVPPKLLIEEHRRAGVTGFTVSDHMP